MTADGPGQRQRPPRARPQHAVARLVARPLVDPLGAAVAGAGLDRHRRRPVPRRLLARTVDLRCRRSAAPSACSCSSCFAVAAAVPLFLVRLPSANDGLRRLDRASDLPHRPATAIADELVPEAGDSFAAALWRAHMERALRAARTLQRRHRRCRGSRRAIPMRCARWCSSSWSRPSSPPAASAPSASPRRSTGRAWWRRPTSASTPG